MQIRSWEFDNFVFLLSWPMTVQSICLRVFFVIKNSNTEKKTVLVFNSFSYSFIYGVEYIKMEINHKQL